MLSERVSSVNDEMISREVRSWIVMEVALLEQRIEELEEALVRLYRENEADAVLYEDSEIIEAALGSLATLAQQEEA